MQGAINRAGELLVELKENFVPVEGQVIIVATHASASGSFSVLRVTNSDGYSFFLLFFFCYNINIFYNTNCNLELKGHQKRCSQVMQNHLLDSTLAKMMGLILAVPAPLERLIALLLSLLFLLLLLPLLCWVLYCKLDSNIDVISM